MSTSTLTRSVKDNASLKVRSGMVTGAKVTLRKDKMYDFLERLVLTIIPRIKYFEGFPLKSVSQDGHFSVRLNPLDCLLLEAEFEKFSDIGPIDVVITTQNSTYEETILMLTGFRFHLKELRSSFWKLMNSLKTVFNWRIHSDGIAQLVRATES